MYYIINTKIELTKKVCMNQKKFLTVLSIFTALKIILQHFVSHGSFVLGLNNLKKAL